MSSKTNWEKIVSGDALKKISATRSKTFIFSKERRSALPELIEEGWEEFRAYADPKFVGVKKEKSFDEQFEDKVWMLFSKMGFANMNADKNFAMSYDFQNPEHTQQIDIFAADDETILIVECKSSEKIRECDFKKQIEALHGQMDGLAKEARKEFPNRKIKFIWATHNCILSRTDLQKLKDWNIAHFSDTAIEYYSDLVKHLGSSAKYQLLGNLFANIEINNMEEKIPAIQGKMGGFTYYSFSIEPERLLKICYVPMTKVLSNNQLLLKECIKQEFDESSFGDESTFFEFFAISQILKNYNLTDDEIENGLTGGGLDGGCDGIYVFLNSDLINVDQVSALSASKGSTLNLSIIQAKNTTSFNEDAIMKFKTISENLLNLANELDEFEQRYNERVIESFTIFRDALTKLIRTQPKIHINFYYITLANELHPNVKQQAEELKNIVLKEYPSAITEVNFINADILMDMYNAAIDTSANLSLAEHPICLGKKNDYVALVNIATYYKFITNENNELRKSFFEANVRDYQGKNSVNTSIAETLSNATSEDFWWLNNGVTVLASEIKPITTKVLYLENPITVLLY